MAKRDRLLVKCVLRQGLAAQNGLFFGGGFMGCFIVAYLPDRIGRIRNIQLTCVTCVIGSILQGAATHIAMLLVGRFLTGLGAGMVNCSIPLYQAEVSPPKQRGRMVGSHGVMLSAGFAFAGWAGYGCYYEPNHDIQWRLLLCLQVVSPAILLAVTPLVTGIATVAGPERQNRPCLPNPEKASPDCWR